MQSNVLVDADGGPVLGGFGLADLYSAEANPTTSTTSIGSPRWMPPELFAIGLDLGSFESDSLPVKGTASDIYSFAMIMLHVGFSFPQHKLCS